MTSWLDSLFSQAGAPAGAEYITLALDGGLSAERVLTPAAGQLAGSSGAGSYTLGLATTAVTPGTYALATVTVDAYGRITAANASMNTNIELAFSASRYIRVASSTAGATLQVAPGYGSVTPGTLSLTDGEDNPLISISTSAVGGDPTLSFYGETPVVRPVLATGAGKTVDEVITVLQTLGLVSQT